MRPEIHTLLQICCLSATYEDGRRISFEWVDLFETIYDFVKFESDLIMTHKMLQL